MTQDVRIDRLSLRVPGLDKDAAEDLARLVALRLAIDLPISDNPISDSRSSDNRISDSRSSGYRSSGYRSSSSELATLALEISAPADLDGLAWRIAGEIRQALGQEARRAGGTP